MFAVLWFFVDSQKMLLFSRQVGVCLLYENGGGSAMDDWGALLRKRT